MAEYRDPENHYVIEYPEGWLPLTHEGSAHVSLASLVTGGYLKIEGYEFASAQPAARHAENTLRALIECEQRRWPQIGSPAIHTGARHGTAIATATFTRPEDRGPQHAADFGHARAAVFSRGNVQVRCLYRCRTDDRGVDDDALQQILNSLVLNDALHLDARSFAAYYHSLLKRLWPHLHVGPPEGLTLTMADGQTVLLDNLYHHYLIEPQRLEELLESHIDRLHYCGDDVPDLNNYAAVKKLVFPKIFGTGAARELPPHRLALWPGLAIGAVVQGRVFSYGVNLARLKAWGFDSLADLREDLTENLYSIPPVAPRGLRDKEGVPQALSYVDHPFCASFVLFEDFFQTTAHNLGTDRFLVGLPDPGCVSCFRDDDPRFVVQHTALLRWDYHRSVERLSDTIYLVNSPDPQQVRRYDILHCCAKSA